MTTDAFEHKKSLGQHFLTSPIVPGWLVEAATLTKNETVLEIGPGTGMLTRALLGQGAQVIALEADQRAIAVLEETFPLEISSGQLRLVHGDARELSPSQLGLKPQQYAVVANIPYYLSGHLFRTLLEGDVQPHTLVFLVQKEVAKRICVDQKRGEKESLLSLSVKVYGTPIYVRTVTRGHFNPPPRVDSAIIAVTNITKQAFQDLDEVAFFKLLHLGFGHKRKQLISNLAGEFDRAQLLHIFSTVGLPPDIRAEDVTLTQWLTLARTLLQL